MHLQDEGQFELEFDLKVENFDAKVSSEQNQQLIVRLVHFNYTEDNQVRH